MRRLLVVLALSVAAVARADVVDRYHRDEGRGAPARAAIDNAERTQQFWRDEANAGIARRERLRLNRNRAKNIVMFLGDGMSVPTLAAARTLLGQRQGRPGEEAELSFEAFPTAGLAKTYCLNAQIPDSACTATAYLCGVKAHQGTLGVSGLVARHDCDASADPSTHAESIAAWALRDGRDAGIVTTTRVTHASPAGAFAHAANRHWENDNSVTSAGHDIKKCPDIAHQLVNMFPGNEFKVILGGGRREFLPTTTIDEEGSPGLRTDGRNLIQEWQANKQAKGASYAYVWNRDQLMDVMSSQPDNLLGLFENDHLQYHLQANKSTEPTLTELTEAAIRILSRNEKGFFLFVESGRIDHGHHDNYAHLALDETIQMSDAVARAAELLPEEDSLIVVTADHAHVMAFNGYTPRGSDILGPSNDRDRDGVPYMTLSYTNGPGARQQTDGVRPNVLNDQTYGDLEWRSHAEVPLDSETHGGDDVAVFARGPHHDMFSGLYEQSQLPHLMAYAGCFGPAAGAGERAHCNAAATLRVPLYAALLLTVVHFLGYFR